jgi:t-SNARE complex subunit (syntaxin)
VRDKNGELYTVRYDAVNAMLLNEFLKEHKKIEKLEATVADLAAQVQKISAQVQMKNSSARVAGK